MFMGSSNVEDEAFEATGINYNWTMEFCVFEFGNIVN